MVNLEVVIERYLSILEQIPKSQILPHHQLLLETNPQEAAEMYQEFRHELREDPVQAAAELERRTKILLLENQSSAGVFLATYLLFFNDLDKFDEKFLLQIWGQWVAEELDILEQL